MEDNSRAHVVHYLHGKNRAYRYRPKCITHHAWIPVHSLVWRQWTSDIADILGSAGLRPYGPLQTAYFNMLVIKSAPLLEDDEDVSLSSAAGVFTKTFHFPQFFRHCSEVLHVFCMDVHCFFQAVTGLCRKANVFHFEVRLDPTRQVTYYRVHHHHISKNLELLLTWKHDCLWRKISWSSLGMPSSFHSKWWHSWEIKSR